MFSDPLAGFAAVKTKNFRISFGSTSGTHGAFTGLKSPQTPLSIQKRKPNSLARMARERMFPATSSPALNRAEDDQFRLDSCFYRFHGAVRAKHRAGNTRYGGEQHLPQCK